ncbi:Uncharacterised protein [BD1-7 clade bacterium]|uniref:Peptidase M14 domain-containing protein n=1 Tax=BD1-7 clade bacterium TaxID=2029982 RepID=A0A5S9N3U3_9GAMM|nr:Uncharacterised protein [BD1-7 clade bacterium]
MYGDKEAAETLEQLKVLSGTKTDYVNHRVLTTREHQGESYDVHAFSIGTDKPDVPVIFFIGGIHGIERIGAQVVQAFLNHMLQRLSWDSSVLHILDNLRLWFVPVANPVGFRFNMRSNGRGVDLMRNAPHDATGKVSFLVGGQRLTRGLPWYRGTPGEMEPESEALTSLVLEEVDRAPLTMVLDVHSGFGAVDRLWFPMASTTDPVPHLPEFFELNQLLQRNNPHHNYVFEPQSRHYVTHGDLWDYTYQRAYEHERLLLPLTLEMGSWRWLRKNPWQLGPTGLFNPVKPHRIQRVLRHHLSLLEFLIRAGFSWENWLPANERQRQALYRDGLAMWYQDES